MGGPSIKVALVIGGSSSIGYAAARGLADIGIRVVIADIVEQVGERVVQEIRWAGGDALFVKTDACNSADAQALINKTVETYGRLDYAVNSVGIGSGCTTTGDCLEEKWDVVVGSSLIGVWLCMKYEIAQMQKQGGGVIVNIVSIRGRQKLADDPAYVSASYGALGLTKVAAAEYAAQGIRVNAICPTPVSTSLLENMGSPECSKKHSMITELHPKTRMNRPEDISDLVLWLCSDSASFVNGSAIFADVGYTARDSELDFTHGWQKR